jgi:hypothetical protein
MSWEPGSHEGRSVLDDRTDIQGHDEAVMPWQPAAVTVESQDEEMTPIETDFVVAWQMSASSNHVADPVPF